MGARDLLRTFFLKNVGKTLTSAQLRQASGGVSEWARRIRELRDEEGFQILTHNDLSELKPGEYVLKDAKPLPVFPRNISKETRAFVLDRNGFTCQMCGAVAGEDHPYDPGRKTRLHIGHIIDKSKGGSDDPANLKALCSVCNEGLQNTALVRPDLNALMVQLRRAPSEYQLEALRWLRRKFPNE